MGLPVTRVQRECWHSKNFTNTAINPKQPVFQIKIFRSYAMNASKYYVPDITIIHNGEFISFPENKRQTDFQ